MTKPYKFVIRGLHSTTNTQDIKEELAMVGHVTTTVSDVIIKRNLDETKSVIKISLPLFFMELASTVNMYEIRHMLYFKVKIESLKQKRANSV